MTKALLFGANDRAMFSMARQLIKKGFQVDVVDWQKALPLDSSRYIHKYYRLNNGEKNVKAFVVQLIKLLDRENYALMIPVNDMALEVCINYRAELNKRVRLLAVPSPENYQYSHDKSRLLEKCWEIGVPAPQSLIVRSLEDLDSVPQDLEFPVVIKPAFSRLLKNNRLHTFTVKRAATYRQMIDSVREHIENCPVIIQKQLAGYGAGFNFLAQDGEVLVSYAHERVHEPLEGGQSSYRKTIPVDTYNLRQYSERLIKSLGWTGLAMIEYRIENGKPYIMEINGRLWGSIELGIYAGVNIPLHFLEHFYEEEPCDRNPLAKTVFARNLKMDIRLALTTAHKQKSLSPVAKWLWSMRKAFSREEFIEDHPLRDLRYEIVVWSGYAKKAGSLMMRKLNPKKEPAQIEQRIKKGMRIGFLCFGNICRSPFADYYAKARYPDYEFSSYGFFPQEERLSPLYALEAAQAFGVDLGKHKSRIVTAEIIEDLDLVLIMDKNNSAEFHRDFSDYSAKLQYLDPVSEIEDPYGQSLSVFQRVYKEIAEAIDKVFGE